MVADLAQLCADDFRPLAGQALTLGDTADGPRLTLLEITESRRAPPAGARAGFALLFEAAPELVLAQDLYRLCHPLLGAVDLLLVPVGASADGRRYEAVFN